MAGCWPVLIAYCSAGKTECVPAHRMQNVEAAHPLVARDDVGGGVTFRMADMQSGAARIGEHVEHVKFRLRRIEVLFAGIRRVKSLRARPRSSATLARSDRTDKVCGARFMRMIRNTGKQEEQEKKMDFLSPRHPQSAQDPRICRDSRRRFYRRAISALSGESESPRSKRPVQPLPRMRFLKAVGVSKDRLPNWFVIADDSGLGSRCARRRAGHLFRALRGRACDRPAEHRQVASRTAERCRDSDRHAFDASSRWRERERFSELSKARSKARIVDPPRGNRFRLRSGLSANWFRPKRLLS